MNRRIAARAIRPVERLSEYCESTPPMESLRWWALISLTDILPASQQPFAFHTEGPCPRNGRTGPVARNVGSDIFQDQRRSPESKQPMASGGGAEPAGFRQSISVLGMSRH